MSLGDEGQRAVRDHAGVAGAAQLADLAIAVSIGLDLGEHGGRARGRVELQGEGQAAWAVARQLDDGGGNREPLAEAVVADQQNEVCKGGM